MHLTSATPASESTIQDEMDPAIIERLATRHEEIRRGASATSKLTAALALGSVPIALGALARDVYGQAPADVVDVLQFALLLEYLEAEFYTRGVASSGLIAAADMPIFTTIRDHENTHVMALKGLLTGKGASPDPKPDFDFTAKGALPGFTFAAGQYQTFLALAQAFEDTGVRAYKG